MKNIFITNGIENRKIAESEYIPENWTRGKTQKRGFKHSVKRSDNHKKALRNSASGKFYITNGLYNKQIRIDDVIPDGWIKGMTRYRRMTNGIDVVRVLEKDIEYFKFIGWKNV